MAENFPYSETVMDHFMNPRNMGEMESADGIGNVGNPSCGDVMRLYIKVRDGIIEDVKFKTFGCGAAIASSSMTTEMIKGKPIEEAIKLSNQAVAEALGGLPSAKMHCSVLAEEALKAALEDYYQKQNGGGESVKMVDCTMACKGHQIACHLKEMQNPAEIKSGKTA